ncbi:MAG TPA: hypothetical protein VEY30_06870, partial [Myxococcaceae bacterium]|nr:hypothetical protein [Myxococcaceae bacterium]
WIDDDPAMRKKTLRYLVECALPGTATVRVKYRGTTESYAGVANLGPSLQAGMMTVVEQERVSACLLARLNARGNTVRIGLFGFYPGFNTVTAQDRADFPLEEAGFFGNIFLPEPKAYVCHQRYENITASKCKFRACVQPDGSCDCGVLNSANLTDAVAPCNNSLYIPSAHCKYVSASNGSYSGQTDCQADGRTWSNVITTRVALKPAGELCFDNMECTDGRCNSGQCAKPLGSTCGGNAECVSDICSGGICVGVPQGGACTTNTPLDLATELPILSSPMNQCASPAACHDGVCAGPSGSTCTASAACLNGTCSSGVCRTHSGGICAANSDCLTNTCLSGRCRSPRNATCSSEFACMPDAVCGVYNMCKGIGGASCSANGDCESYSCIGSICKASRGSCLSDAGCTSGLCSGGMCLSPAPPPKLPRGSACTTGTQCQSGKCSKGKCA